MSKRLWTAVLALAVSGCLLHVNKSVLAYNPTGQVFDFQQVTVFSGNESLPSDWPLPCAECPPAPIESDSIPEHARVALLKVRMSMLNSGVIVNGLREEAGKLGANAIVLGAIREPGFLESVFGDDRLEFQATAIYAPSLDPTNQGS